MHTHQARMRLNLPDPITKHASYSSSPDAEHGRWARNEGEICTVPTARRRRRTSADSHPRIVRSYGRSRWGSVYDMLGEMEAIGTTQIDNTSCPR